MALVSLDHVAATAEAKGFRVRRYLLCSGGNVLEIYAPNHTGPTAVWWEGACYSAASFTISDRTSYGYNDFFHGPWHDGFAQDDDYGLQQLHAHPAWA